MNIAKRALNGTKTFVTENQVPIAIAVTAAVCITATAAIVKKEKTDFLDQVDAFLHEKGVHAEFMTRLRRPYM